MRRDSEKGSSRPKLSFVPYIIPDINWRIIIIEENPGRHTRHSLLSLRESQLVLSGTGTCPQHWHYLALEGFSLWFPGQPQAERWAGELCLCRVSSSYQMLTLAPVNVQGALGTRVPHLCLLKLAGHALGWFSCPSDSDVWFLGSHSLRVLLTLSGKL